MPCESTWKFFPGHNPIHGTFSSYLWLPEHEKAFRTDEHGYMVDDVRKPAQAGSRFLTPTESRNAMIELEILGACWAMKKCDMFPRGLRHFKLITNHQPLIPNLNSNGTADVQNPRLQRLMMKIFLHTFAAEWVKGKDHLAADELDLPFSR